MKTPGFVISVLLLFFMSIVIGAEPQFERQTINGDIQIGYGVTLGRADADDKLDILLADKQESRGIGIPEKPMCLGRNM